MSFAPGEKVFSLNPKYKDGTRLRAHAAADSAFSGVWCPNDVPLQIVEVEGEFLLVRKPDGQTGWIRSRNVTHNQRVAGVTKGVITTEIVTPDPEYVKGIKIYNLGIKEDPVPGCKFGKGVQHLISSRWLTAMSEFVASHFAQLQAFCRHAYEGTKRFAGYDYSYFTNMTAQMFYRADWGGLRSGESVELLLCAAWLAMAAAEVDDFPFSKYSREQRAAQREAFYQLYLQPRAGPGTCPAIARDDGASLGKFAVPLARRDLLPPIAIERLGINNELNSLKYADPEQPMREGFRLSVRIDSSKRHLECVTRGMTDEDHIIHLLWNLHAIYHVYCVFPDKNDLIDYTNLANEHHPHTRRVAYEPTTSLEKILGGGALVALPTALKLDWNEGAIPPPPSVREAMVRFIQQNDGAMLKWYPKLGGGVELRQRLARYCGGSTVPENILVCNGSDDALVLICHALLGAGKSVVVPSPSYEHFCVNAAATGASLIRLEAAADAFSPEMEHLANAIEKHRCTLVYLVSPNNPTGAIWPRESVRALANRYPDVTFIVDEAYIEFTAHDPDTGKSSVSSVNLAIELPNIIVTRTFSKAFCLAAVRCGYIVAHPNTVENLRCFYNPKAVNQLAQIAAEEALKQYDSYYRPYIKSTNEAREEFVRSLRAQGVDVRSGGGGNFVCVRVGSRTKELCAKLEAKAIFVRDISGRFPGFIRITIGIDMSRVVEAVVAAVKELSVV